MTKYICEACLKDMTKTEEDKNIIERKSYCNTCYPKVQIIVGNLQPQKNVKIKDVDTWYDTEKAAQIAAQCPKALVMQSIEKGEDVKVKDKSEGGE